MPSPSISKSIGLVSPTLYFDVSPNVTAAFIVAQLSFSNGVVHFPSITSASSLVALHTDKPSYLPLPIIVTSASPFTNSIVQSS